MAVAYKPPSATIGSGAYLYRLHQSRLGAVWFGRKDRTWRYDDPKCEYGVMYLGRSNEAAYAEAVLRDPSQTIIMWSEFEVRRVTTFRVLEPLSLAIMHGAGLAFHGVEQADVVASDYDTTQTISRKIHESTDFDGIQYRSRFDSDELCVALFERSRDKIAITAEGEKIARIDARTFAMNHGKRLADM